MKALIAYRDLSPWGQRPWIFDGNWGPSLARVLACCAEDFAVGLGCLFAASRVLRLRAARWYQRGILIAAYLGTIAAIDYMLINVQVYHVLGRFLNFSFLQFARVTYLDPSVYAYTPAFLWLGLYIVPGYCFTASGW